VNIWFDLAFSVGAVVIKKIGYRSFDFGQAVWLLLFSS